MREDQYLRTPDYIDSPPLPSNCPGSRKIGLAWRGSPTHSNDHHRSCPLETMLALTGQAKTEYYALNIELSKEERELLEQHDVHILEHNLNSFAKTAAYIEQLGRVICVDTSVAHLTGALNIPVSLLLSVAADWRWKT